MKKLTNKKGFTLVELVIVIAILAIIAAIAIPLVSGQIAKANNSTDASNAQAYTGAIKLAVAQYEMNDDQRSDTYKAAFAANATGTATMADVLKWADVNNPTFTAKNPKNVYVLDPATNTVTVETTGTAISAGTTITLG